MNNDLDYDFMIDMFSGLQKQVFVDYLDEPWIAIRNLDKDRQKYKKYYAMMTQGENYEKQHKNN